MAENHKHKAAPPETAVSALSSLLLLYLSLKEVRSQLLISHDEGVLNHHELLLCYDLNRSNILHLPYDSFPDFNFDDLEDDERLSKFRFHKRELSPSR